MALPAAPPSVRAPTSPRLPAFPAAPPATPPRAPLQARSGELRYSLLNMDGDAKDAAVQRAVDDYNDRNLALYSNVLGTSAVELDCKVDVVRARECKVGNFIADAFRVNALCEQEGGPQCAADVVYMNGGGIRGDTTYPAGDLTKGDIMSILVRNRAGPRAAWRSARERWPSGRGWWGGMSRA